VKSPRSTHCHPTDHPEVVDRDLLGERSGFNGLQTELFDHVNDLGGRPVSRDLSGK